MPGVMRMRIISLMAGKPTGRRTLEAEWGDRIIGVAAALSETSAND
jgi:hypothetical protein